MSSMKPCPGCKVSKALQDDAAIAWQTVEQIKAQRDELLKRVERLEAELAWNGGRMGVGRYLFDCGCAEIDGDILFCKAHRGGESAPKVTSTCDGCDQLRAEVAKLKALCAARPKHPMQDGHFGKVMRWQEQIDAAGRGEG